jgi:5-methyltetrahydrofolate--homocysteine methyltransferase
MHAALCATRLNNPEVAYEAILMMVLKDSMYPTLVTSHYNNFDVFNVDANGAIPQIINEMLIPALDKVGEDFESQRIFLPQLINSANASCEAFEVIKEHIRASGGTPVSKGKIVVATVKGDVHDIGKNIARVVLENYGYQVIDLGKDVAPERIVETAIRENVRLIGLSALMTTTLSSMETTIKKLREAGHDCKIFVGGAVLTPAYASQIGADYYADDAKMSADIAKKILG